MPEDYIIADNLILDVREVAYAAMGVDGRLTVFFKGCATPVMFHLPDTSREVFSIIRDKLLSRKA